MAEAMPYDKTKEGEKPPYGGFLFFGRTDIPVCSLVKNLTLTLSLKRRGDISCSSLQDKDRTMSCPYSVETH